MKLVKMFAAIAATLLVSSTTVLAEAPKVEIVQAFPELRIARPIVVTHANDGSNRLFVASQIGKIYCFENKADVTEPNLYLDIEESVRYIDKENEEGLLGFAIHPNYKKNGQFFLFYTTTDEPHVSVISRFNVSSTDPSKADPDSEVELMRIPQPFWNHNGGTLAFGHDGYLYIALGDGGKANDPFKNGQNLATLNGSVLRIDVDKKSKDHNYAIPADNPFVGLKEARPEIYAYGFRNVWRLSFDRETGALYAADVGQNIWEEINIVVKGGNYGWNLREAKHKFGDNGSEASDKLIDPIFEYHHDVGKSITGGHVYRGSAVPSLKGMYMYADYVSGKVWALEHTPSGKILGNHEIKSMNLPIITFGEDEQGEVYLTTQLGGGIIYKFATAK
ncbi:MAG TPA: glucose sorbosone dehydrogenase [Planctomycetaceae bacterium]|jgi:glucose/arabinose dehydrogenase|nr:PQQ-dependent sugar dehydrogenase [Pirellulales bacterium]HAL13277.1 glucose sorbosone dehydrogenase [Planctomycetaceae bacterium]HCK72605.1 glucose sorbosone dehydrogenase [Planctomycetaceae bacterium]HCP82924.1 glucose sorbosone dehydrogenase [Planctomycetaceae bacterium]|tara:strand:+ start:443 stop:1615 length:1173 start_codon:yes stop_codon:yes gene_type:complete